MYELGIFRKFLIIEKIMSIGYNNKQILPNKGLIIFFKMSPRVIAETVIWSVKQSVIAPLKVVVWLMYLAKAPSIVSNIVEIINKNPEVTKFTQRNTVEVRPKNAEE